MHGSNPPQDQGASLSDMFEEMNVDHEPLFVINKKTLKGAVGPKIGMNVARISAALAKKPVFFLDRNSNADESVEQEIAAGAGGLQVPGQPTHQRKKREKNMQWQNTVKEMLEKKRKETQNIRKKRQVTYLKKYEDFQKCFISINHLCNLWYKKHQFDFSRLVTVLLNQYVANLSPSSSFICA